MTMRPICSSSMPIPCAPTLREQWVEAGDLLDLTPYKETGLKCIFDKFGDSVDTPYLYYNDRMYMIPTNDYQDNAYYTMYFRQDWAETGDFCILEIYK